MNRKTITILVIIAAIAIAVFAITEWQRNLATIRLLSEITRTEEYPKVMDAMEQLQQRGGRIMPALIKKLQASEPQTRWRAAMLLGEVGNRKAWEPLTAALGDKSSADVRAAAALALGKLNAISAAPALRALLADAKESLDVRLNVAIALGYLRDKDSVDTLTIVAAKRPPVPKPVPVVKAGAVAPAKPAPAKPALVAPAPPPDTLYELRVAAVRSLGMIADARAIPVLIDSANTKKEPHVEVRTAAAYAMGDLARRVHDRENCTVLINGLVQCMNAKVEKIGDVRAAAIHAMQFVMIPSESDEIVSKTLGTAQTDDFYWARLAAEKTIEKLGIILE